jgi:Tfp pilus assembly protein PilN
LAGERVIGRLRSLWRTLGKEVMAGAGSLGAYYDQRGLTLAHLEKGFVTTQVNHVAHLEVPAGGLAGLAPRVRDLLGGWDLEQPAVGLAVSPHLGFVRPAVLPLVAKPNLDRVVAYEIDRFLPLGAEQLVFDYVVSRETDTEIHLLLLALPRVLVNDWLAFCTAAGLSPVSVELAPLALANAFALLQGRLPASWLLLALNGRDYELLHVQQHRVRSWHPGKIPDGSGGMAALATEVQKFPEVTMPPQALCISGAATMPRAVAALQEAVTFPVISDAQVTIKGLDGGTRNVIGILPALGVALRGVGKVPLRTNLLPVSERAMLKLTGLLFTRFLLILLLSLTVVWLGSIFIHSRITLARVNRQVTQLAPSVKEVEKQLAEAQNLARQYLDLQRRVEQHPGALPILRELTQIIPEHTHIFSLRLTKGQIELSGKSASASDLINLLEKSGRFTKTEFVSPIVSDETGSEIFKIKADVKSPARGS